MSGRSANAREEQIQKKQKEVDELMAETENLRTRMPVALPLGRMPSNRTVRDGAFLETESATTYLYKEILGGG